MSDNTDNTNTDKPRGQRPKTETEIRQLFAECVDSIGAEGLRLNVETKVTMVVDKKTGEEKEKTSLRCSIIYVDDDSWGEVIAPVAGNTFARLLEGAKALGPYSSVQ